MDLLVAAINAVVIMVVGAIVVWVIRGRFEALDRRIDRMETLLDGRIDTLQSSVDAMRSDLTRFALAVGTGPRAQSD